MKITRPLKRLVSYGVALMACSLPALAQSPSFVAFESASVRPMAMSADGSQLYVTNTPDNVLDVFNIDANGVLSAAGSIPVGLEPVAVAVHNQKIWVVNHLSDSVSVIDPASQAVVRTLLVGDEPRDIVFAKGKAFITTAHRGQHRTHGSIQSAFDDQDGDPQIHTPSVPRADVWVFNSNALSNALGGRPAKVIEMFGDTPRGLAVSPDGETVYAAVFNSGNQTSVVHEGVMCYGFEDTPSGNGYPGTGESRNGNQPCVAGNIPAADAGSSPNGMSGGRLPKGRPLPSTSADGKDQPYTSVIVKYDRESGKWKDTRGLNYSNGIRFTLPDHDVFAINATTLTQQDDYEHVGTTLFNIAVNPVSGKLYVSNTDANNAVRFEGPGIRGGSTVQGHIAESRITVIDPSNGQVQPRHLNTHINYSQLKAPASVKQHTVSTPLEMQVSDDGSTLFVAALGSNKIAVYDTQKLENGSMDPTSASQNHIPVTGGPQGILLNESAGQLYVLTRYDNSVKVIDVDSGSQLQQLALLNPEPAEFQAGRFMLYDADRTSSNGESSCGSCHVFGDMDHLAWNLGNPDGSTGTNTNPFPAENLATLNCDLLGANSTECLYESLTNGTGEVRIFNPMKGPMTTQTMRGMSTHGHMHWRGDRVTGYFGTDNPNSNDNFNMESLDERLSFKNFIVAFEGLLGMEVELDNVNAANKPSKTVALENDIDKFADFMLAVQLPPNPIRPLDNSHSASAQIGDAFFDGARRSDGTAVDYNFNGPEDDGVNCEGCHTHDPSKGFYGTDGKASSGGEFLILKPPHFRNLYQRIGMFGLPNRGGFLPSITQEHQGEQIRGFGFLHDGATDSLFNFLSGGVFDNGQRNCAQDGYPDWAGCDTNEGNIGIPNDTVRQGLVDYMLEFDSDLAPVVGQQITLYPGATNAMRNRLAFLETRSGTAFVSKVMGGNVTECDLVARGVVAGNQRGYLYSPADNKYIPDDAGADAIAASAIRTLAQAANNALTFTCVPPGSGERIALDRDQDGIYNCNDEGGSCGSTPPPVKQCVTFNFNNGAQGWSNSADANCRRGDFVAANPTRRQSRGVVTQVDGAAEGNGAWFTATNDRAGRHDVDGGVCLSSSPVIDTRGRTQLNLEYFHGQRDANDDNNDYFGIYYSIDGGQTNTALVEIGDVRSQAQWQNLQATLPESDNLTLWVATSDGSSTGDVIEGGIDAVSICE